MSFKKQYLSMLALVGLSTLGGCLTIEATDRVCDVDECKPSRSHIINLEILEIRQNHYTLTFWMDKDCRFSC